jgi:hypothetical protein
MPWSSPRRVRAKPSRRSCGPWIDSLREPVPDEPLRRCRVVYVSPLKALAVDVERNLRAPLVGIGHAAHRLGAPAPEVTVALRSGDTPAADRRAFAKRPSDILITTPESLFLLLTSGAREALAGVETVILDEVHAVAGTKRGAHLAVTLDRLDALLERPAQRIGLSATVRPDRGGGSLSQRRATGRHRCPTRGEIVGLGGGGPRTRHGGDRHGNRRPQRRRRGTGATRFDLAARGGAHRRPGGAGSIDADLRQLASARRAPDRPPE